MLRSSSTLTSFSLELVCFFPNFLFVKNSSNCRTLSGTYKNSHCSFFNVQISFTRRPSLSEQLVYYITSIGVCQYLFESFLSFFQNFLFASLFCTVSRRQLYYITTYLPFCQYLFSSFFDLCTLFF